MQEEEATGGMWEGGGQKRLLCAAIQQAEMGLNASSWEQGEAKWNSIRN
jgi:hypothetical protein